ncbi:glycoside hydrolase family 89 protein [Lentithecium fluviatile CBS 122367]|uniref:Glycoside hydrolase family 89 protein n=1 Tax=Lentithecium fluviatile CBS 122367 TaxID=1168545 RepID=A0A6G1J2Y1_9PLEO|nr:glycoside hydrolase family 89 protein [Lentithecium fluviatile CBS 122367]
MRLAVFVCLLAAVYAATSTEGLYDLVKRRLPGHCDGFIFIVEDQARSNSSELANDEYSISTSANGSIAITGNSLSALSTGLRRYLTDVANVDIYWFIDNRLDEVVSPLPRPRDTITGTSIVPWRYYFNTVTFSYTTPFWSWSDWELELDWLALHGVNLPLAWVGFEKILLDVFQSINLTTAEIIPFFSGPAFQAWNRFGNIQGSWGGELPLQWIDSQFELQQKILTRMLELGMTPILPAFTGFVPRALLDVYPDATVVNGSQWEDFPVEYTNTTFLEPSDALFTELQNQVITKQIEYYGNITQFYTLDQYNENDPFSGDLEYLHNVTHGTWQSIKSANPAAVWVMQGWLFTSNKDFWTNERIEAYLSGVEEDEDMLVLDLFSESEPQWQRTNSYFGKPWIWNMLHNYGGNMGLYGQISNVTINPIEALANSSSLVGFGLTPEGQGGNEIMYKLLLDQAWQTTPIDTVAYFQDWVHTRYAGYNNTVPKELYTAWELLRISAYNNTNLTSNAVPKAIFELAPNITRLTGRTGHHPTTVNYDPEDVVEAWRQMYQAATCDPNLWSHPAYTHDLVDVTRQVYSNAFLASYTSLIATWSSSSNSTTPSSLVPHISTLTTLLTSLSTLLSTLPQFSLTPWLLSARALAPPHTPITPIAIADLYEYNARNQITQWGPGGEINDYASKSWGGLVGDYYLPRWQAFLGYLASVSPEAYEHAAAREAVVPVERAFQEVGTGLGMRERGEGGSVREVEEGVVVPGLRELGVL